MTIPIKNPEWVQIQDDQCRYLVTKESLKNALDDLEFDEVHVNVWGSDYKEPPHDGLEQYEFYELFCNKLVPVEDDRGVIHSHTHEWEWEDATFTWTVNGVWDFTDYGNSR